MLVSGNKGEEKETSTPRHRILLVDDDPYALRALGLILSYKGYHVRVETDGEKASALLASGQYDLMLATQPEVRHKGKTPLRGETGRTSEGRMYSISRPASTTGFCGMVKLGPEDFLSSSDRLSEILGVVDTCLKTAVTAPEKSTPKPEAQLLDEEVLRLLMVMSHDTRGSLIAIGAGLKMLSRGLYGRMDESAAGKLSELYGRARDLVGMAEEFLAEAFVLRDGSPRMAQDGIDLRSDVIGPVLDELSVELHDHGAKVKADLTARPRDGLLVTGNRTYLKAVVRNLVRNAIHHGGEGCTISVKVEDDGPFYRLHVSNSGPAIPPEIRDDLFEPAPRASFGDEARSHGMGFGLFLVKEIVRKHGGEIWHEPGDDGTSFIFTLPRSEHQSEYFRVQANQDFRQDGRRPDGLDRDAEPDRAHS